MIQIQDQEWFTVQEVSIKLRVHINTVYRWMEEGRLKYMQVGINKKILIPEGAILALIK